MSDPIQTLMDEHRLIEKVLDALEAAAERDVPASFYSRAADFFAGFADRGHHAKEEARLFPMLEGKGLPRDGGPIGVMCAEHVAGRGHVGRMRELAESGKLDSLRREAAEYIALLRAHIMKEDQVLFAMARNILDGADMDRLEAQFADAEAEFPDREAYLTLAGALCREAGTAG